MTSSSPAHPAPLVGHVALVTGAGRGIGRAHALRLAELGASVVVSDIGVGLDGTGSDESVARTVAEEINGSGGSAVADDSDIASFPGAARAVATGVTAFGKVDIVINNAGIPGVAEIETINEEQLRRQLAVHVSGSIGTARAAWRYMRAQRWGRVVNTVSEEAFPSPERGARGGIGLTYGSAKGAVWAATFAMAVQGSPHGITVNAISPGAFTRMNAGLFEANPTELDLDPAHVAAVAGWLATDAAGDVTGRVIHVAGVHRREYVMTRRADTDVVRRIDAALAPVGPLDPTRAPA